MKIEEGNITILVSADRTTIEIRDTKSNTMFCRVVLTPEQLSMALSRLSHVSCEVEVYGFERIGKTHESKSFEFEIPKELRSSSKSDELKQLCINALIKEKMADWIPDNYFASQNSFFERNGVTYANATIRRWI